MKKLLLSVLLIGGISFFASAQQTTPASPTVPVTKESRKAAHKKMAEELGLSKEQSKELKEINKDYKDKMLAVKDDSKLSDTEKKEKLKALNTERQGKVNEKLTPDQQTKMATYKKEHMKEFGHKHKDKPVEKTDK